MDNIDPNDPMGPDITAGEFALGVLEGEELVAAQRLYLSDRDFADSVRWWRYRLSCMSEAAGAFEPSADVWSAIERRLDGRVGGDGAGGGGSIPEPLHQPVTKPSRWGVGWAMAGAAAAAAALTFVLIRPAGTPDIVPVETPAPDPTATTGERLIAQLASEDGTLQLTGFVDPRAGQLALNASGFAPGEGQAAELWVVPEGGTPQSLGLIPASGTFDRDLTERERAALVEGASLAVTYEDASNAPHEAPSTEILVIGGLTSV